MSAGHFVQVEGPDEVARGRGADTEVPGDHLRRDQRTGDHVVEQLGQAGGGAAVGELAGEQGVGCACRKSNPDIFVMQSAEDWFAKYIPCPLYGAR